MLDYNKKILEEHKEIIDKYIFDCKDRLLAVCYYLGREYTFGYDYVHVYFRDKFQALIFLMKHKDECMPKNDR